MAPNFSGISEFIELSLGGNNSISKKENKNSYQ